MSILQYATNLIVELESLLLVMCRKQSGPLKSAWSIHR